MNRRLSFILLTVFAISFVLLGFSYSKESGTLEDVKYNDEITDNYRIVYSNGKYLDSHNYKTRFNLINLSSKEVVYEIRLKETQNQKYGKVYYKIDGDSEKKLSDDAIMTIKLKPYGSSGDLATHDISLVTTNKDIKFKIVVSERKKAESSTFVDSLKKLSNVYQDKDGNYRFYGRKAKNNYIRYNGETCQIIGIVDGKIKIVTAVKGLGSYKDNREYVTLKDYLYSFNNSKVNESNVLEYRSWLTGENGYWLKDTTSDGKAYYASKMNGIGKDKRTYSYYQRYVYYIPGNAKLLKGDGSSGKPYEVTYESK